MYVTVPTIDNHRHTDTVSQLFHLKRILGEVEDKEVAAAPKRLANTLFADKTETQINHRMYLRVSRRLELASDNNFNTEAKLLLLQGYYMQQLIVKNNNPDEISVDGEACCIWMKILEMCDKGMEIWPGIVHRAVRGILKYLPDIDLDKALKYSKIGLKNGSGREEVYVNEIMLACVYAARRIERTRPNMNLDIAM